MTGAQINWILFNDKKNSVDMRRFYSLLKFLHKYTENVLNSNQVFESSGINFCYFSLSLKKRSDDEMENDQKQN